MLRAFRERRSQNEIWRKVNEEVPCSLIEVVIPDDVIPRGGDYRWELEGKPIREVLDKGFEAMRGIYPEITYEEAKAHFKEFTFNKIPPEWVKTHYPIVGEP